MIQDAGGSPGSFLSNPAPLHDQGPRPPSLAKWYAMAQPITPAPTTMTSADFILTMNCRSLFLSAHGKTRYRVRPAFASPREGPRHRSGEINSRSEGATNWRPRTAGWQKPDSGPARHGSSRRSSDTPDPKTMALGGVATGSMKAPGRRRGGGQHQRVGLLPGGRRQGAAMMGMKMVAVAVLEVSSVRKMTTRIAANISTA